jgi:hypothetical protein
MFGESSKARIYTNVACVRLRITEEIAIRNEKQAETTHEHEDRRSFTD